MTVSSDAAPWTALVLAGRRRPHDPLTEAAGVSHKALIPVGGEPMLARVLHAVMAGGRVARAVVSVDDPDALHGIEAIDRLRASDEVALHRSRESPSASVLDFVESQPAGTRIFVTTADHPLLTAQMVEHFLAAAEKSAAQVVVGMVDGQTVDRAFPAARRTFVPLRGVRVTGANLFALQGPDAVRAPRFWRQADRIRKRPWRLVGLFGAGSLLLFGLRRLDLAGAMARAGARIGAPVEAVLLPFAECAIDVDRIDDLELASRLAEGEARPD